MTSSSDPSDRVLLPLPESFPPGTQFSEVEDVLFAEGPFPGKSLKVDFFGNVFKPDLADLRRAGMNGTSITEEEFFELARRAKDRSQNGA